MRVLCRVLEVSPSGYYAWRQRQPSARARRDQELLEEIRLIHAASAGSYGSPRVHAELRRRSHACSRGRVERLMRSCGLRGTAKHARFRSTTQSQHQLPVAENLLGRNFHAEAPNQKWTSDITYIPTQEGWLYLAVVIDLFSRRVVGWAMSQHLDQQLVDEALRMALVSRQPKSTLLLHSDRGVQYAARATRQLLRDWSVHLSMSRRGDCFDNAPAESFFASLKKELVHRTRFSTRDQARQHLFVWIEIFYNRQRLHSALGYRTPLEVDQLRHSPHLSPVR